MKVDPIHSYNSVHYTLIQESLQLYTDNMGSTYEANVVFRVH